jgi:hypothetical protein
MSVHRLSFHALLMLFISIVLVVALFCAVYAQEERAYPTDSAAAHGATAPLSPGTTPTTWGWLVETIDTGLASVCCYGDVSLALDQSGYPHISYYDQANNDLKYAFKDTDGWHISTLDQGGGKHSSIALDSEGYPHIVYWQNPSYSQCGVRYTYQDDAGWHDEVVADVNDACSLGGYTRLVLDPDDRPHTSYGDYDQRAIIYGYRDSGVWHLETAASRAGSQNALDLDGGGRVHIAYYEIYAGDLYYTYRDETGWHSRKTDDDIDSENISLKVDGDGYPHISYNSDWTAPSGECLRYAHQDASGWYVDSVDCEGFHPGEGSSLFLDASGVVHISYQGEHGLTYAYQEEEGWRIEAVDLYYPLDSSLMVHNTGQRHIAYTAYTDGVLRHAYYGPVFQNCLPLIKKEPTPTPAPTATPTPTVTPTGPTPTPTVTPTPAPCPQRAGTWRGTADFTVSSDRNTVIDFSFEVSACGSLWRLTADQLPISSDCKISFAASSGSALLTGSGTFESETKIRGSWTLISTTCLGWGSWSSSWRSASNANTDTFDEGTEVHTDGTIVLERVPVE